MQYIKKKINNFEISFEDEVVQKLFEPITSDIVESFNKSLNCTLKRLWIDVGNNIYDLHIEIYDDANNIDYEDLYFIIKDDNLIGTSISKGIDLKKNFDDELVEKMIHAIKEYRDVKSN